MRSGGGAGAREGRAVGVWHQGLPQVYKMRRGCPRPPPSPLSGSVAGSQNPRQPRTPARARAQGNMAGPGGGGLQHQRPAAVARDERPGVGLLADGQAGGWRPGVGAGR